MKAHVDCDQHGSVFTVTRPDRIIGRIWHMNTGKWACSILSAMIPFGGMQKTDCMDFQAALVEILLWKGGMNAVD